MKNKLLLTTALATSLVAVNTVSFAAASVSGSIEYTYNSAEDTASDTEGALGVESTVKFSGSTDAEIGTITSGFNLEDAAIEAPHIKVTNGDTTVGVGADFAPNLSVTFLPNVGDPAETVAKNVGSALVETTNAGGTIKNGQGLLLSQKFDGGNISMFLVPDSVKNTQGGGGDSSNVNSADESGSGYNVVFTGNLGIDGLSVLAGINDTTGKNGAEDGGAQKVGVQYNFGSVTVGLHRDKVENVALAASQDEYTTTGVGLAFAVNDNFSVSASFQRTDGDTNGVDVAAEEEIRMISAGYNLGGLGLEISYAEIEDVAGTAGSDGDAFQIRTVSKF
jgi:hypothetical protein